MSYNNEVSQDHVSIANLFAGQYNNVYTRNITQVNFLAVLIPSTFSISEIKKVNNELDEHTEPGPDNIHPGLINNFCLF